MVRAVPAVLREMREDAGFTQRQVSEKIKVIASPLVKIVPASGFSPEDRWDVARSCAEEELVSLGEREDIDVEFVACQLRSAIASGNFLYEAKLFVGRVRNLTVSLSVKPDGTFDLEQQQPIARAIKRFDNIRARLHEIGKWSESRPGRAFQKFGSAWEDTRVQPAATAVQLELPVPLRAAAVRRSTDCGVGC